MKIKSAKRCILPDNRWYTIKMVLLTTRKDHFVPHTRFFYGRWQTMSMETSPGWWASSARRHRRVDLSDFSLFLTVFFVQTVEEVDMTNTAEFTLVQKSLYGGEWSFHAVLRQLCSKAKVYHCVAGYDKDRKTFLCTFFVGFAHFFSWNLGYNLVFLAERIHRKPSILSFV